MYKIYQGATTYVRYGRGPPGTRYGVNLFPTPASPPSWGVELPGDPEATAEVVITPTPPTGDRSPARFLGAGKGLFSSAAEIDAHIRRNRDAREE